MKIKIICVICVICGCCLLSAQEVDIGISKQYLKKIKLGINEFTPQTQVDPSLSSRLKQTLLHDFTLVDYFSPVEGTAGTDFILKCSYELSGANQLIIEGKLYESQKGQMVFGKRFSGTTEQYKKLIHSITDSIITQTTGEKGIALTKLTFEGKIQGVKQIFVSDFDGFDLTQLTKDPCPNLFPGWSPDGNKIVYMTYLNNFPQTFIYNLTTHTRSKICWFPGLNTSANYSPNGSKIALTLSKDGNPEIYTINIDGSGLIRITNDKGVDTSPCWSHDGRKIAFVSNRSGSPQIYTVSSQGGTPKRITYTGSYNTNPNWSPKGDLIVYNTLSAGTFQICTIDADTGETIQITNSYSSCENPSFAPDGRHIVFSMKEGYNNTLCLMDIYFREIHKLKMKGGDFTSPDWSLVK